MQMHPFSLRFSDRDSELGFIESHRRSHSLSSDWFSLMIYLPMTLLHLATQSSFWEKLIGGMSLLLCLLQWRLMVTHHGRFSWCNHREVCVALFRLGRIVVAVSGVCLVPKFARAQGVMEMMLLQGGAICHLWLALSMPLLVRKHIWVQCLGATGLLAGLGKSVCLDSIATPTGGDALITLWHKMDTFLTLYGFGGHATSLHPNRNPGAFTSCVHLTAFIHVIVGVLIPSFILWKFEFESRKAYVKKMSLKSNEIKLELSGIPGPVQASVVLFSCTSIFWVLLRLL